jgi:hypothetical protein
VQAATEAGTARYAGDISREANRAFFDSIRGRRIHRLTISSDGGEVEAGIELGRWVFQHRLDVEVLDRCLSACANYVFPAGRRKIIRDGAVVAWHGSYRHLLETGLWTDDVAYRMRTYSEPEALARRHAREQAEHLARLEDRFFEHIGVDGRVCWIGKLPPYAAPNYYFLSADDMARFGIRDVESPPEYPRTDLSGFAEHIVYLKLESPAARAIGPPRWSDIPAATHDPGARATPARPTENR